MVCEWSSLASWSCDGVLTASPDGYGSDRLGTSRAGCSEVAAESGMLAVAVIELLSVAMSA